MTKENLRVLTNIIGGVESGGQVYGCRRYDAYAAPGENTSNEVTCTLGWAQNYANEGRKLCRKIFDKDKDVFRKADTADIESMLNVDWLATKWHPTAKQKNALIDIITTDIGMDCQDELFEELMLEYAEDAKKYGVTSVRAQMMWCEIEHLGGLSPTKRVFARAKKPYTPDSVFESLMKDQKDTSNNNQVGDKLFQSRHECCLKWIKKYAKDEQPSSSARNWLQKGDSGEDVRKMQELLISNGFNCGDCGADGEFGEDSERALMAFQEEYGLAVDGQYGNASKKKLEEISKQNTQEGDKMTKQEAINKVISVAKAEDGYLEKRSNSQLDSKTANAGSNNYTKYWRDLANWGLGNYQAQYWCAAFVHWCFTKAFGLATAKKLLLHAPYISCDTMAYKSKDAGQRYVSPQVGDVVVFYNGSRYNHTGIVYKVSGGYFYTIEGNTSGASGVISNGGGVVVGKKYKVAGTSHRFHRPKYEIVSSGSSAPSTPSEGNSSSTLNESSKWTGVITSDLNIRTYAGASYPTVSFSPLKEGAEVGVCDTVKADNGDNWYYILYNKKYGFASAKYIKKKGSAPATPSEDSAKVKWIKDLQKAIVADVDGEPGSETLGKCPTLKSGSRGTTVKLLQRYLGDFCRIGVSGGYDGDFGAGTKAAVMEFQKQKGLTIDGIAGRNTWKKILGM